MILGMEPDADRYVRASAMALAADDDPAAIYGDGWERIDELPWLDINAAWQLVVSAVLHTVSRSTGLPASDVLSLALLELEGGVPLADPSVFTDGRHSTVTAVVDTTPAGRELRVHVDAMGLQALREGHPIVVPVAADEQAAVGGFAQIIVTTAPADL